MNTPKADFKQLVTKTVVWFAAVLFFAAIANIFDSKPFRVVVILLSYAVTLGFLTTLGVLSYRHYFKSLDERLGGHNISMLTAFAVVVLFVGSLRLLAMFGVAL